METIPEDFEGIRNLILKLELAEREKNVDLNSMVNKIREYLKLEGFSIESELKYISSAKIEKTDYFIWKFIDGDFKCYVTLSIFPNNSQAIKADDSYGLSAEQYIFADYNKYI